MASDQGLRPRLPQKDLEAMYQVVTPDFTWSLLEGDEVRVFDGGVSWC